MRARSRNSVPVGGALDDGSEALRASVRGLSLSSVDSVMSTVSVIWHVCAVAHSTGLYSVVQ